ncbi:Circadian locomoter output cycles protein kaput [Halotydeus destructor]|nr:Circadian locomoter output cycles protein kaput [Halotydeus destructor]
MTSNGQSGRLARNLAEKQRRDRFNGYVNNLANETQLCLHARRRLDKTSILRLAASQLRLNQIDKLLKEDYGSNELIRNWRPQGFGQDQLKQFIDSLDGFMILCDSSLKLIVAAETCEAYLGHQDVEMIGHNLMNFIHPGDEDLVKSEFEKAKKLFTGNSLKGQRMVSDRISLRCRMREKSQPRTDIITYRIAHIRGYLTYHFASDETDEEISGQLSSRKRSFEQMNGQLEVPERTPKNGVPVKGSFVVLFKGFIEIKSAGPSAQLSLSDANQDEYVTRISLDGTLLFADHRISTILGFMPHEVVGQSAYNFILVEDHTISLFAHKLMLSSSNGTGLIVHRLRTKSCGYVFIQSAGCLVYDSDNGQVDHFVCVARLLVEEEGGRERDKFARRFTPHVMNVTPPALYQSLQVVIGPNSARGSYSEIIRSFDNFPPNYVSPIPKPISPIGFKEQPGVKTLAEEVCLRNGRSATLFAEDSLVEDERQSPTLLTSLEQSVNHNTINAQSTSQPVAASSLRQPESTPYVACAPNFVNNSTHHLMKGDPSAIMNAFSSMARDRLRMRETAAPLMLQLQKNVSSSSRYTGTGGDATKYSIDSMTQYNGPNENFTGAIVFGIDAVSSSDAIEPRYANAVIHDPQQQAVFQLPVDQVDYGGQSLLGSMNTGTCPPSLGPRSEPPLIDLEEELANEVDLMTTSMPTPPLIDYESLASLLDDSGHPNNSNQVYENFDLYNSDNQLNNTYDQSSFTPTLVLVDPETEGLSKSSAGAPSVEMETLKLQLYVHHKNVQT